MLKNLIIHVANRDNLGANGVLLADAKEALNALEDRVAIHIGLHEDGIAAGLLQIDRRGRGPLYNSCISRIN